MSQRLTEYNIAECQTKFNLTYHVSYAYICQQLVGFEGKDVLEVGGSLPKDFVFDYLNVKSWSALETPDYENALKEVGGLTHEGTIIPDLNDYSDLGFFNRNLGQYNFFLENIENLPSEYYSKYDLVFSLAAFEHIHKFPLALEKMFLALKPVGQLFSMFSPIWSAFNGHHLPEITDKQGNSFNFGNSPIPPWGHLLMRPGELCQYLCQYTDKETAYLITYYVYNSPHINRFFTEDYVEFIKQSSFTIKTLERTFNTSIKQETQLTLEKLYPGRTYFKNNGILVVLEKVEDERTNYTSSVTVKSVTSDEIPLSDTDTREQWQLTTPVCLIIFNRPDTTEKVFETIRQAKPPKLFVIADGPRETRPGEADKCAAARAIINRVDWDCEILTNYSDINLGDRKRIVSGLNWVFNQIEEAIILEDDCLPHPTFFRFCEELLERYRDDERIMVISGDNFQFGRKRTNYSYYFSLHSHLWGWASWRRAWQHYDDQMSLWPEIRQAGWLEDLLGNEQLVEYWSYYFQESFSEHITRYGWDCRFSFACWIQNGLSILPNVNLVSNIGFSPDASHTTDKESKLANIPVEAVHFPLHHPNFVIRDTQADDFTEQLMHSGVSSKLNKPTPASTITIELVINQAIAQLNANNNTEALSLLEEAIAFSPDLSGLNYAKAITLARLGRTDEAVESLKCLLAAVPNHKKGQQLLAELCTITGKNLLIN